MTSGLNTPSNTEKKANKIVRRKNARKKRRHSFKALRRWLRKKWYYTLVAPINHDEVVAHVHDEGLFSGRYAFFITASCAIAIMGLLLSSPAVVIGAMLLSPLMGPIMSLGFSLCTVNIQELKIALKAITGGVALALTVAALIVAFSPLSEATPEILSRTKPNFLDLLVAIFSGLAGGYAVVHRKGEAVVGVAIATALMPPLAVTGFGLATFNGHIAQNAFMLFMTNMLAIALTVTIICKFYGFGTRNSPKHTIWQAALIFIVFTALSVPLGLALKQIARQTYATKLARHEIKKFFAADGGRISSFNVYFPDNETPTIEAIAVTAEYKPKAEKKLSDIIADKIGRRPELSLDQIVVKRDALDEETAAALTASKPVTDKSAEIRAAFAAAIFFPVEFIDIDPQSENVTIFVKKGFKGMNLPLLQGFEEMLAARHANRNVRLIPPYRALPPVRFIADSVKLTQTEAERLTASAWALERWGVGDVSVIASVQKNAADLEKDLAVKRAERIARYLNGRGARTDIKLQPQPFENFGDDGVNLEDFVNGVEIRPSEKNALQTSEADKNDFLLSDDNRFDDTFAFPPLNRITDNSPKAEAE